MAIVTFNFVNSAASAGNVKQCYASQLNTDGFLITRLFGNVFIDFQIPNVNQPGITWNMTANDDPVIVGGLYINSRHYYFLPGSALCFNLSGNTWRIFGIVQQVDKENGFDA